MRLGIISNPVSQLNHRFPPMHWRLARLLKKMDDSVRTSEKSEIPEALRVLLFDKKINVLGINGGDGTIHAVVNSLNRMVEKGELSFDDLPLLLFMNGGTYNMAARAFGTKDDPVGWVRKFLRIYGNMPEASVPYRELKILKIEFEDGSPPDYGMVFGTEVIANALELCDRLGSGYLGLLRLLLQGSAAYILNSRFYRENLWRLLPVHQVSVNGEPLENCVGVLATTIDLMLLKGFIKSATVNGTCSGFFAKAVITRDILQLIRLIPSLMFEKEAQEIRTFKAAESLQSSGRFTLDGEIYESKGRFKITLSPFKYRVVDMRKKGAASSED